MGKYKILLVDDDSAVLESVCTSFQSVGYIVETANSGEAGLAILKEKPIDIVITDLIMGTLDGLAVLKQAKDIRPEVIVIILTGFRMIDAAIEAFRLGADDFLIKPLKMQELKFRVARCIETLENDRKTKAWEDALKISEANFRALVEFSVDHIFMLDLDGIYRFTNKNVSHLGLQNTKELLGSSQRDIYSPRVTRLYQEKLDKVIRTRQPVTFEYSLKAADNRAFHLDTLYPILSGDELVAVGGICKNITEQKKLESQLSQSQKMEALGTLVAGVAHEINNPINLIMFNLPLLQKIWRDFQPVLERVSNADPDAQYGGLTYKFLQNNLPQMIADMDAAAKRVVNIVNGLKSFSRKTSPSEVQSLDINTAVKNAVKLIQITSRKSGIELIVTPGDDLPMIKGNLQNIEQIIMNLAINAIQSIDHDHGRVEISTGYAIQEGDIYIKVSDNGQGINPEIADKIFNPFVTDKQLVGGTGLGLSVTYGLVKDHGGHISFKSNRGKGTVFTVRIAVRPKPEPQRILVADDDPAIRRMIVKTLSRLDNCIFEQAVNGIEALIKLGTFRPDLLILDVLMPEMDGLEVCRTIKKEPELSAMDVIIISGFLKDPRIKKVAGLGFTNMVQKPLAINSFRESVFAMLERRRSNGKHSD